MGFDFDDTIMMGEDHVPRIDPQFFECIRWVRSNYGAAWGICTGRSLTHLVEGFNQGKFPFLPDFTVVREREVYFPGKFGRWMPDQQWNTACFKDQKKLFRKAKRVLAKIQEFVETETKGRWVSVEGDPAGIVSADDMEMERNLAFLKTLPEVDNLSYERNGIYLRFTHSAYRKGTGLQFCARRWGVPTSQILAVGDNFNDLSMLDPAVSGACGCPSNAILEVKKYVAERGGKVASKPGSEGVMEVLGHYFKQ